MTQTTGQFAQKTETKRKNPFSCQSNKDFSETTISPFSQILHLQRTVGNRAVTGLLQSGVIQAKLKISKPDDKYEQESDRAADRVMRIDEGSLVQRKDGCPDCPEKENEQIQQKPLADQITPLVRRENIEEDEEKISPKLMENQQLQRQEDVPEEEVTEFGQLKEIPGKTPDVTPDIESNINSMKGGGQPLSESSRAFFESRFGVDFSQVRVHNDSRAANIAQAINAKAFTTGKDIVFNSGQYSPGTSSGKRILAHELTHVVQQHSNKTSLQLLPKVPKGSIGLLLWLIRFFRDFWNREKDYNKGVQGVRTIYELEGCSKKYKDNCRFFAENVCEWGMRRMNFIKLYCEGCKIPPADINNMPTYYCGGHTGPLRR